jgi:hypothetical protein
MQKLDAGELDLAAWVRRGDASVSERKERLLGVADPQFRESLARAAHS